MTAVYTLQHSYEKGECDETKFIGVYSSEQEAKDAINRLKDQPGFCDMPEAFHIDKYQINKDSWAEGFATVVAIKVKTKDGSWMVVEAKCLPNDTYRIIELYDNHLLGEFKHLDIVECEERGKELYAVRLAPDKPASL
jgi:hypothetical protein